MRMLAPADVLIEPMSQELIELRLGADHTKASSAAATAAAKSLLDRLLSIVTGHAAPAEGRRIVELRASIEGHRRKIAAAADWMEITDSGAACLGVCQQFFDASRVHGHEREEAIEEVVTVLREALQAVARETGDYHSRVLETSERLSSVAEITDLREIKRRISTEVEALTTLVAERKKEEEQLFSRLARRAESLSTQLEEARDEASRDGLTHIANRLGFDRTLDRWISTHWKRGGSFSVAMLDVDNFKSINDSHGHPVGDRVLTTIAARLQTVIRTNDFAARYGGEEFVVLLDGMKTAGAREKMQEFLAAAAKAKYEYQRGGKTCHLVVTLSGGVTEYVNGDTRETIVARADEALYDAKHKGKNRIEIKKLSRLASLFSQASRKTEKTSHSPRS